MENDAAAYKKLQDQFAALDDSDPDFDAKFESIMGQMEEIKNRNHGYAPGTEPKPLIRLENMPVTIHKHGSRYSVDTPNMRHAKSTTLKKAKAQRNLLNAIDHSNWRPTHRHTSESAQIIVSKMLGENADEDMAFEDGAEPDQRECNECGGPVYPMGKLGNRTHGRCRNCGLNWSWVVKPEPKSRLFKSKPD